MQSLGTIEIHKFLKLVLVSKDSLTFGKVEVVVSQPNQRANQRTVARLTSQTGKKDSLLRTLRVTTVTYELSISASITYTVQPLYNCGNLGDLVKCPVLRGVFISGAHLY